MIAALSMYDRRETAGANDRLWAMVREQLDDTPEHLTRGADDWANWRDPDLLLSQTCGYPYRLQLHATTHLVGTPVWDTDDAPGYYHSVMIAHKDHRFDQFGDFKDAHIAVNSPDSQSGWAAPMNDAAARGFSVAQVSLTGGHIASAKAVSEGRADIAAIDVISWTLMTRYDDWTANLKVVGRTTPTPTLPYITAHERNVRPVFKALEIAIARLSDEDRHVLCLRGLTHIDASAYMAVPNPASP